MSGASDALHYKTAVELAAMIRSKQISCLELLEHFLARCDSHNAGLNAIVVWSAKKRANGQSRRTTRSRKAFVSGRCMAFR